MDIEEYVFSSDGVAFSILLIPFFLFLILRKLNFKATIYFVDLTTGWKPHATQFESLIFSSQSAYISLSVSAGALLMVGEVSF